MQYFGLRVVGATLGAALLLWGTAGAPILTYASMDSLATAAPRQYQEGYGNPYSGNGGYSSDGGYASGYGYPSYYWLGILGNSYPGSGVSAWSGSSSPYATGANWTRGNNPPNTNASAGPLIRSYGYAYAPAGAYYAGTYYDPWSGNSAYSRSQYSVPSSRALNGSIYQQPLPCITSYNGGC